MNPSIAAIAAVCLIIIITTMAGQSDGRELRPADHGLEYQESPPPGNKSPEMESFFGGAGGNPRPSSSNDVALPWAMNSNDTSWWTSVGGGRGGGGGGGGDGGDHVRHVLVVASVVCGITGVALFVASAFIYLFRYKKQKSSSSSSSTSAPPVIPSSCDNNSK
ncbi:Transmembrane protein [Parasponia andersonii]|uniref:Transmembrane protein n=1 Tax=Parasponia andersonii TaxID=3476 RepID=A0A2P5C155_PARAD|nr:Transmembrane protein [Parasponia andersonii]